MEFTIRLAKTISDIRGLINVQIQTWAATYPNPERGLTQEMILGHLHQKYSEEKIQERYRSLKDPSKRSWIALNSANGIVGWMGCNKTGSSEGGFGIYVLPEYQGQGIGKALFKLGLDWLSTQDQIAINVLDYNTKAIEIYKKLGFELTGAKEDFPIGDFVGKGWCLKMVKRSG